MSRTRRPTTPEAQEPKNSRSEPRTSIFGPGAESELEMILANRLAIAGLPPGERQYRFDPRRRFRFDMAWPALKVAVEVQGGIWSGGRHARGSGIAAECHKFSLAAALGWRCLPVTREMIEDGTAVTLIHQALHGQDCQCTA